MNKSILDRPRADASTRLERYLQIERGSGPHPAVRVLHRKRRDERPMALVPRNRIMWRRSV
ncbi:MAG: hypothetical protein JJT95_00010 [Pararhodobacter sp.]|nr:hypothetical protein [Pararhodobacter sp.]